MNAPTPLDCGWTSSFLFSRFTMFRDLARTDVSAHRRSHARDAARFFWNARRLKALGR